MIRYIKCTLESATDSQIEEVFFDAQDILDLDSPENPESGQMVTMINEALEEAEPKQVEDVYWTVLYACD